MKNTDISVKEAKLYILPGVLRMPLKFGAETVTAAACARTCVTVEDSTGKRAAGWGETPVAVSWSWPSSLSYGDREKSMIEFCKMLTAALPESGFKGHPIEIGHSFTENILSKELDRFNASNQAAESMPWLSALICSSAFDIAVHDAYGNLLGMDVYDTYNSKFMNYDLAHFLEPVEDSKVTFKNKYPTDFLNYPRANSLWAWHLVGGKDPLDSSELTGAEPNDGYPVILTDWIKSDGLKCLKIKLRGNDSKWDYERIVKIGQISAPLGVLWLTADFNCLVTDPAYVTEILDRLIVEHPSIYQSILYIEQPFPYDLEKNRIDVHSVSARKPLFMDESAHDWKFVAMGRELGWTGVALKTCKTQTGALLSLSWAKAHGMTLMVQDLTNPMLAQIPHVLLAAHVGTIMGVETNGPQFFPELSKSEEVVHPGLYNRRNGKLDLSTVKGSGFGYRLNEIIRQLPSCVA